MFEVSFFAALGRCHGAHSASREARRRATGSPQEAEGGFGGEAPVERAKREPLGGLRRSFASVLTAQLAALFPGGASCLAARSGPYAANHAVRTLEGDAVGLLH